MLAAVADDVIDFDSMKVFLHSRYTQRRICLRYSHVKWKEYNKKWEARLSQFFFLKHFSWMRRKKNATLNCLQFNSNEVPPQQLSAQYKIASQSIRRENRDTQTLKKKKKNFSRFDGWKNTISRVIALLLSFFGHRCSFNAQCIFIFAFSKWKVHYYTRRLLICLH